MEINATLLPPTMPNFIRYEVEGAQPGLKQDGFKPDMNTIPVRSLTEQQAKQYAELMANTFLQHWKKLTSLKPEEAIV